ncbi:MAG: DUF348 domain-containing protein, partial [Actinobacteria bacterium]|nr:DUF348 domain-containing protein [Actinomycetota bacterium]
MAALTTTVVLAVAGTTLGYSALTSSVTLTLDGRTEQVRSMGGTVAEVLESQGVEIGPHDIVAPDLDEPVEDGSSISVLFGRPFTLSVDGTEETHWVTATTVAGALEQIGRGYRDADLSLSRGGSLDRSGASLEVVTPKTLTFKIAGRKAITRTVTALTVEDALAEVGVKVHQHDRAKPGFEQLLSDGD